MKWIIFQWVDLNYHFLYSCISHIFQIPIYRIKFPVFWASVSEPLKWQGSDRCIEGSIFSLCCHFHWGPLNCIRLCLSPSLILSKSEGTTSTSETGESLLSILLRQEYWVRVCLLETVTRPSSFSHSFTLKRHETSHFTAGWVHASFTDFLLPSTPKSTLGVRPDGGLTLAIIKLYSPFYHY